MVALSSVDISESGARPTTFLMNYHLHIIQRVTASLRLRLKTSSSSGPNVFPQGKIVTKLFTSGGMYHDLIVTVLLNYFSDDANTPLFPLLLLTIIFMTSMRP